MDIGKSDSLGSSARVRGWMWMGGLYLVKKELVLVMMSIVRRLGCAVGFVYQMQRFFRGFNDFIEGL